MKTILITGGTGFVGSYLVRKIIENNLFKIIILSRENSDFFRIDDLRKNLIIYHTEKTSLDDIFKDNKIDGVIHLSTYYTKNEEYEDIEKYIESNIELPTKILHYAYKNNVRFFINTGSFFEYNFCSNPINESSKLNPSSLYSSSKISFDIMLKYYSSISNMNVINMKLSAVYGYNDKHKLISYLMKSVINNKKVILEKGEHEWDFIYVKDVVSAYLKAIDLCLHSKRNIYEDVLIGTAKKTSIKKVVHIINKCKGKKLIKLEKDYPSNQIFVAYLDNSKAKNLLQWIPQYLIEDGLKETYNLYKASKNER